MGNFASVGDVYTKRESDDKYQEKGNTYTKSEFDSTFLKKVDAANMYQPIGSEFASISFVNNKFAELEKSIKTDVINLGEYSITNTNSQLCLKRKNETQSFCFDGKIVIKK